MALVQRLARSAKDQYIIPESLTHNSGTISATVNGVNYTCSLSGLTANTLYFLYLRSGQSNIQFVTTVPSSYRASFPEAILIGAFYANGLSSVAFGSFVNIEGEPSSDWWDARTDIGANFLTGASGNPSYGTTTTNIYKIRREGNRILGYWRYRQTGAGGGGSGNYYIKQLFPAIDTYYRADNSQIYVGKVGEFHGKEVTSGAYLVSTYMFVAPSPNQDKLQVRIAGVVSGSTLEGDWGSAIHHLAVANISYGFDYDYVTSSFSLTPLKDL